MVCLPSSHKPVSTTLFFARAAAILLSVAPCRAAPFPAAFSTCSLGDGLGLVPNVRCVVSNRVSSLPPSVFKHTPRSLTSINASREHTHSSADSSGLDVGEENHSYPVQIHHQGHVATIYVRKNEPILQALERQSTISNNPNIGESELKGKGESSEPTGQISSLALSHIPHECRRGNCLTCSSRIVATGGDTKNLLSNVNNGLAPTVASALTKSGYILTCCSFVTGPGVVLELDQNDQVWDIVHRKRICNEETIKLALEAQARLKRRVDEDNLGTWKRRMEENWESEDDVE